jgi:hypothetical protein
VNIRPSVFGSKSEERLYSKLASRWSNVFNIYPNLPLTLILHQDKELDREDWEYFKKASVDFTLCALEDNRPILSIEFDGLTKGFSREDEHVLDLSLNEKPKSGKEIERSIERSFKIEKKLRWAGQVGYPLIVVSFEEAEEVCQGESLTILDGIIGHYLARKDHDKMLDEYLEELRNRDFANEDEFVDAFDNVDFWAWLDAERAWDPFTQEIRRMNAILEAKGTRVSPTGEWQGMADPPIPPIPTIKDLMHDPSLSQRWESDFKKWESSEGGFLRLGTRRTFVVSTNDSGTFKIEKTVWLRNFGGPWGAATITSIISEYLAYKEIFERFGQ